MNTLIGKRTIILIIASLITITSMAQSRQRKIYWNDAITVKIDDTDNKVLYCEECTFLNPETFLPYFTERINLPESHNSINTAFTNMIWEEVGVPETEFPKAYAMIPETFSYVSNICYERKKPVAEIYFMPLRKNPTTGKIEKLVSYTLETKSFFDSKKKLIKKKSVNNSVLASGTWKKIKVVNTGVQKITYKQLASMGFSNPENIKVFGNAGKQVPVMNSEDRYEDLVENPIYMEKGTDGIFNDGDYILFYGHANTYWTYDTSKTIFRHKLHPYSEESFYFLTDDGNTPLLIQTANTPSGSVSQQVNSFDDYFVHETESINFIKSGQLWLGEQFSILLSYDFSFYIPNVLSTEPVKLITSLYTRATANSSYNISVNNSLLGQIDASGFIPSTTGNYASNSYEILSFYSSTPNLTINISYNKPNSSAEGWLDYLDINARRSLTLTGGQTAFRDIKSVGTGEISEFTISSANANTVVWDVTNPVNPVIIPIQISGSTATFKVNTDSLREFVAFDGTAFYAPTEVGTVENQNLHNLSNIDMIIVAYPDFINEANELADFHRQNDNLTTTVVTPQQIYNEFSSGMTDPGAIRDFMRNLYDKAGSIDEMPKYLLLFGDGSFDNKHNFSSNTNFIPTYQSESSLSPVNSFTTDDFFVMLDPGEGGYRGTLDLGVGRFPVKNSSEASAIVSKIKNYKKSTSFGDWRNQLCFIADDEDNNSHMSQSNGMANRIDTVYPVFNIEKIFLDAYQQQTTTNGDRYPDVNTAISNRMKKGALLINYTGHGNEIQLTSEQILSVTEINNWYNPDHFPLFVTATCEFSRFDDYNRTSAGELIFLNPNGGGIGLFTTTRLVYALQNETLNKSFFNYVFEKDSNNNYYRLGDIMRLAKNGAGSDTDINKRNFTLLGDPALTLVYPELTVTTDSVNGISASQFNDTLKALQLVTIKGHINNSNGSPATQFNGIVYLSVFDKATTQTTLANDGGNTFSFKLQNNILYKGKASIENGYFEFSFIIPRDINYTVDNCKISYYAYDLTSTDANGYNKSILLGGSSATGTTDDTGPEISLFMNDENFVFGGITTESPNLIALLADSSGINTVGNGIGHDITAILDDVTNNTLVLNDYYEADLNSFRKGQVEYPLSDLSDGLHSLKFKAWDINNNSSDAYIEFVVAESQDLVVEHIFNYPNPFTTHTDFYFNHNQPSTSLDVLIQVFTITGKLVKTISTQVLSDGFVSDPIPWDGLDDYGDPIGKGVYVYRLSVRGENDDKIEKYEKLVILK